MPKSTERDEDTDVDLDALDYFPALALASVNGPNFRGSTHNVLILQIREIYM